MDLGSELVACALREGSMRPFLAAGINREWLTDPHDKSNTGILGDENIGPFELLLNYWDEHRKVPSLDIFQRSFPADTYALPATGYEPAELIKIFQEERRKHLVNLAYSDLTDIVADQEWDQAVSYLTGVLRTIRDTHVAQAVSVEWDAADYDVEGRIARKVTRGVPTGVPGLDGQEGFFGFQKGSLICYLGRAKASKTSLALLSAMKAWEQGRRVLFVSFEIAAGRLPSEPGITDRLDCFGAGISLTDYMNGKLTEAGKRILRRFRKDEVDGDSAFKVVQPTGKYTIADLEADIDRHQADVVYVDGFYFMWDLDTGKSASHWEAHDNLAGHFKTLAMTKSIPVIITHQVREKQLTGRKGKGIDDSAMMGGTAIIMFADMVLGVDVDDDDLRTISCTRSRLNYLRTVYGKWDWSDCTFNEQDSPEDGGYDAGKFGYGKKEGKDDDGPAPWE